MLKVLVFIVFIHQVLYWIWLWQLKEYRLDRFKGGFSWKCLIQQFDLRVWWQPKLTLRAVLSAILALILNGAIVLTPLSCALAVGLVSPVFIFWKEILVWRAKRKLAGFKGTVIGITGSYGKSSTKEMLAQVLSSRFQILATQGNNNSEIGVAQTVLKKLKGDEDFFIVEMGAYKIGEIRDICKIVRPKVGIITGIGDQHLELFGSLENIRQAKYELIDSLPTDGFGLVADKDFKLAEARNIKVFKDHVEFIYQRQKFSVKILGKNLIRNVIGVIKVAEYLGLALPEIGRALRADFADIYPRLLDNNVVDNSYNSSLESFLSALDYLKTWKGYKKIVVTPGFMELGKNAKSDWGKVAEVAAGIELIDTRVNPKPNYVLGPKTVVLLQGRVPEKVKNYLRSQGVPLRG